MKQLENAIKRGFAVDRDSIIDKLKEEVLELEQAPGCDELVLGSKCFENKTILDIARPFFKNAPLDNEVEYNASFYENYFKDTEIGELGDIITVCMTRLQHLGINVNNLVDTIAIYNRLRND